VKKVLGILLIIFFSYDCYSQFVYKLKADSVKITNDSCNTELIIENSSKNVCGFLFNNGNGRTIFKKALTPIANKKYLIGCDTLDLSTSSPAGTNGNIQFNNSGAFGASSDLNWDNTTNSLKLGGPTTTSKLNVQVGGTYNNVAISAYSTNGSNYNVGVEGRAWKAGITGIGVQAISDSARSSNYGIYASASGGGNKNYGIYAACSGNDSSFAGYFNGKVFTTGSFIASDKKLKTKVKTEEFSIEKIKQLKPVSYSYLDNINYLSLPKGLQHGFIAQELQMVFPEMVTLVKAPVFEKDKPVGYEDILAINYPMLISILTNAVKEQQSQIESLKAKTDKISKDGIIPEYENNDAALKGGLSIGDFYRTGDVLKVVH
jgi:hypothetical protein